MKRLFLVCLAVLLASIFLVAAIEYDPGYLLISYGEHTLETSVWIGLALFIILLALLYGFFSLLRRLVSRSRALNQWFSGFGYRRSQEQTTLGLIAFIEGNWQRSRQVLSRAAEKSETPLLNYLIAAKASNALGDSEQVKEFLKKAEQSTSGASIAVELTQAELQLSNGRLEPCLATLTRIRSRGGKHPHVLRLLTTVYKGLNDSSALLKLLPELKKYHVLPEEELLALELSVSKALINDTAKIKDDTVTELTKAWQSLPKNMMRNSDVVACYATQMVALGEERNIEKLVRNQLSKDWNKPLIDIYGRIEGDDVSKQLLHAENWLKERNNDAALLLCLGRLSMRNSLWGKAREYFENSLKLEDSSEVCAELGRLLSNLGKHELSNDYFQRGLSSMTNALPALPVPHKK
jgi:HemY protein